MRFRFQTMSGERYTIDTETMQWERSAPDPITTGTLHMIPSVRIAQRVRLQIGPDQYDILATGPVVKIELLDQ